MSERECGHDPMGARPSGVDTAVAMIATLQNPEQATTEPPFAAAAPSRHDRRRVFDQPTNELRARRIEAMRERLRRADYEIDAGAVAEAMMVRLRSDTTASVRRQA